MSMRLLAAAAFLLIAVVAPAPAGDTMTLEWKWEKGARFELRNEERSHTRTVTKAEGVEQKEEEDETQTALTNVEVVEVLADGGVRVLIRYRELDIEQTSPGKLLKLHGVVSATGKPLVTARMEMPGLAAFRSDGEELLRTMGANLLSLRIHVELSRAGEVRSARGEGDLLAGVRRDTPARRIMAATLERMLTIDDLAQAAAGEAFPQLPPGPVARTARWPAKRVFSLMGLTLRGKGAAFVTRSEPSGDVVVLGEEMVYELDSKGFSKMLESVFAEALPGAKVKATLRPEARPLVRYSGRFDGAAGHPLDWNVPKLEMKLVGTVGIAMGDIKSTATMRITVTGDSRCTWTKL